LIRDADAAHMMSLLPAGAPHIAIPDADHHVMVDQPLAFVAALRGLLAGWP
jgi:pimeloyl-ACP methyl ester carboxylesterase